MGKCMSRERPIKDTALFSLDDDEGVEPKPSCRNYAQSNDSVIVCTGIVENTAELCRRADATPIVESGEWWLAHVHHAVYCVGDKEYTRTALWGLSRWHRGHARIPLDSF